MAGEITNSHKRARTTTSSTKPLKSSQVVWDVRLIFGRESHQSKAKLISRQRFIASYFIPAAVL